jgi:hypothetical protein
VDVNVHTLIGLGGRLELGVKAYAAGSVALNTTSMTIVSCASSRLHK